MSVQPELAVERGPATTPQQRAADLALADQMYVEGQLITAETAAAVLALWAAFDPALEPDLFLAGLAAIVDEFALASREIAVRQVQDSRRILGLPPVPDLLEAAEALETINRDRTPGQLAIGDARFEVMRRVDRRRARSAAAERRERELARLQSERLAAKRALDAGRNVVTDLARDRWMAEETGDTPFDREIIGWYRKTDGDPCSFCALLASRGAVYSSRYTAGVQVNTNANLDGSYNASWHPNCNCVAKPLYSTELDVPDLNIELRELWDATRRERAAAGESTSPEAMRRAYRRAIEARSRRLAAESGSTSETSVE